MNPPNPTTLRSSGTSTGISLRSTRFWAALLAAYALLGGAISAAGWLFHVYRLTDWEGNGICIKFNTALAIITAGAALLFAALAPRQRLIIRIFALATALIGGLTLSQNLLGINLGIDQLFVTEPPNARATVAPGRMGLPAATSFILLGLATCGLTLGPRQRRIAAAMATAVTALALLALTGYWFGADMLYTLPRLTAISMQTATMILALGVGVMFAVPEHGLVLAIGRKDAGGAMLRRILLPSILVLLLIGWLRVLGQDAGLYDTAFGSAASALTKILLFTLLLWWNAAKISSTDAALRDSQNRYRAFIAQSSEGVWRLEFEPPIDTSLPVDEQVELAYRNGRLAECNESMARMYGLKHAHDLVGRTLDFMLPAADPATREYIASIIRAGYRVDQVESLERDAFGNPVHFSNSMVGVVEDGRLVRMWGTQTDISDRRRAEEALRESEARLRLATQIGKIGIWEWNIDTNTVAWTDSLFAIHGVRKEDFDGTVEAFANLVHPDDRPAINAAIEKSLRDGTPYEATFRAVRPDGQIVWLFTNALVVRANGKPVRMYGATADLTDFKRAEETGELLSAIVVASDDAIVSRSLDGTVLSWNPGAERLYGYEAKDIIGRRMDLIIPPDQHAQEEMIAEKLRRGERIAHYETVRLARDGRRIDVSLTVSPLRDSTGRIVGASKVARDITEQKRTREELQRHREHLQQLVNERTAALEESHQQLRHSERMAAIGTLSAGLGHDMGNLLVPLRVRLETLEALNLPEAALEEIRGIRATAEYFRRLASGLRLLALDPRAASSTDPTCLGPWWSETEAIFRNVLPPGVSLAADLGECADDWVAMSKPALTQAIFNLVQNAGDAIKPQGAGSVTIAARRSGDNVLVSVIDTGPGMTDEVRRRCMEPFFTTKTRGLSTGLGLALVHGLTQEAGASVQLESRPGAGTTFTLVLRTARPAGQVIPGRRAFVGIEDPRMRGYVAAELKRLAFEVRFDLEQAGHHDLVVVGEHLRDGLPGRVVTLSSAPRMSEIREILRAAAASPAS